MAGLWQVTVPPFYYVKQPLGAKLAWTEFPFVPAKPRPEPLLLLGKERLEKRPEVP